MAINRSAIATKNISDPDAVTVIQFLQFRPVDGVSYSPARTPGQLFGVYNGTIDVVELYVVASNGTSFLRVG